MEEVGRQVWGLLSSTLVSGGMCGAFTSTRVPTWISAFAPVWLGPRVGRHLPALAPESGLSDSQGAGVINQMEKSLHELAQLSWQHWPALE